MPEMIDQFTKEIDSNKAAEKTPINATEITTGFSSLSRNMMKLLQITQGKRSVS